MIQVNGAIAPVLEDLAERDASGTRALRAAAGCGTAGRASTAATGRGGRGRPGRRRGRTLRPGYARPREHGLPASARARLRARRGRRAGDCEYLLLVNRRARRAGPAQGPRGARRERTRDGAARDGGGDGAHGPRGGPLVPASARVPVRSGGRVRYEKTVVYFLARRAPGKVRLSDEHSDVSSGSRSPRRSSACPRREAARRRPGRGALLEGPGPLRASIPPPRPRADAHLTSLPHADERLVAHLRGGARLARALRGGAARRAEVRVHVEAAAAGDAAPRRRARARATTRTTNARASSTCGRPRSPRTASRASRTSRRARPTEDLAAAGLAQARRGLPQR